MFIIFAFYVLISCYYLSRKFGIKKESKKESLIIVLFIIALGIKLYLARTDDGFLSGDNTLLDFALYSVFYYIQILIVPYFIIFGGVGTREKGALFLKLPLAWFLKKEQKRKFISKISSDYNELFSDAKHKSICLKSFLIVAVIFVLVGVVFPLIVLYEFKIKYF